MNSNQTTCTVTAEFCGTEASHYFNVASGSIISTTYSNGDVFEGKPIGTTYEEIYGYVAIGSGTGVYTLVSPGTSIQPANVVKGQPPHFIFKNISTFGVYYNGGGDIYEAKYYIKGDGPLVYNSLTSGNTGMYVLHLLEGISTKPGLTAGWLDYQ